MTDLDREAEAAASVATRVRWVRLAKLGPAFVAAVAYVDPGNVATNTAAGAGHGFLLLWVVVLATVMAGPVQYLSAKLGIVARTSLPGYVGSRLGRRARLAYWVQAEAVAVATDVAEIIGAAVALHLLFGVPLIPAGLAAAAFGMLVLLARDRFGAKAFEITCTLSLLAIGSGFLYGLISSPPQLGELAGGLIPGLDGAETVLLTAGIVGATVMPHAVYLHSGLTAESDGGGDPIRTRLHWTRIDVGAAMLFAGAVNISMLVLGATALRGSSNGSLDSVAEDLASRVSQGAGTAFCVALLVSGLASTAVGTQAGSYIMGGLLERKVPEFWRRCFTVVPALALLASGAEPLTVLVISQVVLALGLPFALIPLVRATGDPAVMGADVNSRGLHISAKMIVVVILVLDLSLVALTLSGHG
ncbi:Nramp family divalent metal transporter [Dermacoccaceae bacterium W4C1]